MSLTEQQRLEQALLSFNQSPSEASDNPLDDVKKLRRQQLDACDIRRSAEIDHLLKQAKEPSR